MKYRYWAISFRVTIAITVFVFALSVVQANGDTCTVGTPLSGGTRCSTNTIRTLSNGYSYQYWYNEIGSANMTVYGVDAAFKVTWTNVGNFLGRVGLGWNSTKTYDQIGTISADFAFTKAQTSSGGLCYIGIYGWSLDSLHEYYIVEDWFGGRPTYAGTRIATITVDGGEYDVLTHTMKNQPTIKGTNDTFVQFWSLRKTARQCGHISISEHFAKWAQLGLRLGKMEEARICVESMNNSGTVDFTKATVVVTPSQVLPQPSRGRTALAASNKESGILSLISPSGKVVRSVRQNGSIPSYNSTANLPNGIYLLRFQGDGKAPVSRTIFLR